MAKRKEYTKTYKIINYNDRVPEYTKTQFIDDCNITDIKKLDTLIHEVKIKVYIDLKINYLGGKFYCTDCEMYFDNINTYSPHMIEHLL